jgi:ribonucleoside-triphosphate reductase
MRRNGEPGFFNSSLASVGEPVPVRATAPCGELSLRPGEPCVLMHVNMAECADSEIIEIFRLTARACVRSAVATGTQRIGVGFLGLQEYMAQHGWAYRDPDHTPMAEKLRTFHQMVRVASDKYTTELGAPQLVKVTAVAPTGTIAKLTDTTEGAQPVFADYFLLRTRVGKDDVVPSDEWWYEDCVDDPTMVVQVRLCESSVVTRYGTELIDDTFELKVEDHLRVLEMIQANYADNGVSYTVNYNTGSVTHEEQVALLKRYLPRLKGLTFLPNGSYVQPPYEPITIAQAKALGKKTVQMSADPCRGRCSL